MSRLHGWPSVPAPIPLERRTNYEWLVETEWFDEGLAIRVTKSYCDSENFRRKAEIVQTSYLRAPREQLVAALALAIGSPEARGGMMRYPAYDPMQVYANRAYSCHRLDKRVFKALNESGLWSGTVHLSCTGCLDAVDSIPGGSMRGPSVGAIQTYVQRADLDTTPEFRRQREEYARQLIEEILAQEAS